MLCSFHGSVQIISADTGSYRCPAFELGESVVTMRHSQGYMLVLTSSGLFYSWDLKAMKVTMTGISIAAILNNYEIGGKIVVSQLLGIRN